MPVNERWAGLEKHAQEAVKEAIADLKAHGIPIFYRDRETGMEIMEEADGRRFEIRYIPGLPRDQHVEVIRELKASNVA